MRDNLYYDNSGLLYYQQLTVYYVLYCVTVSNSVQYNPLILLKGGVHPIEKSDPVEVGRFVRNYYPPDKNQCFTDITPLPQH